MVQSIASKVLLSVKICFNQRERMFVASKADRRTVMGSYRSFTFAYFKPFLGLKYTASPDWLK